MNEPTGGSRETILPWMLMGMLGLFFLGFLMLATGGFFLWVALVAGAFGGVAWFHYVVWGRLMNQRTAGEREEAELFERARAEDEP